MSYHLTEQKTNLIPVDCPTRILHNAAENVSQLTSKQLCSRLRATLKTNPVGRIASIL